MVGPGDRVENSDDLVCVACTYQVSDWAGGSWRRSRVASAFWGGGLGRVDVATEVCTVSAARVFCTAFDSV